MAKMTIGMAPLDKQLSYCRETALQGALVLAKSGRLEQGDNILRTLYVYLQLLCSVCTRPKKLISEIPCVVIARQFST